MVKKMEDGAIILTKKEAKALIEEHNGMVHTFYNIPIGLVGMEHTIASVYKDIDNAKMLQLAGKESQAMHHALAILNHLPIRQSDILFVRTDDKKVKKLLEKI